MKSIICIVCKTRTIYSRANVLCLMCMSEVYEKFQSRIKAHGPIGQNNPLLQALLLTQQGQQKQVVKEKV